MAMILAILLGLTGYTTLIALAYFICKLNKIGITEYKYISNDDSGAKLASIFWPIGVWFIFCVLFFKMLDSGYERLEKKRTLKKRMIELKNRELELRLEELERELNEMRRSE
jgi:hypothetical protein